MMYDKGHRRDSGMHEQQSHTAAGRKAYGTSGRSGGGEDSEGSYGRAWKVRPVPRFQLQA